MNTRTRQSWYLCRWLMYPQPRVNVTNSQLTYALTLILFFAVFILLLLLFKLVTTPNPPPSIRYIPMVEFNRGDVNKEQVMDNARKALEKVSDFNYKGHKDLKDPKDVFHYMLQMMSKKEKRQFLALEAFNIFDIDDFESLMALGYDSNPDSNNTGVIDYKSLAETIEHVSPDYDTLCYETAFTLSNSSRPLASDFCSRLKSLESEILNGQEPPLLTVYTWWPDPLTDPEVLSKRAVMANWNMFRPFIVPVVLTNYRMNMAVANGQGWPCLPVTKDNDNGVPVFKHTAVAMDAKFNTTFHGYAMANSMFDSSLLQTLLSIKDRFVNKPPRSTRTNLLIHGNQINMPALGINAYTRYETFHKIIENELNKNQSTASSTKNNYIFYRDIDFSNYLPVVVDDDYLIPYLVRRGKQDGNLVINTSETILSAKTYRHKEVNEWGRRYIKYKPRDILYNKRLVGPEKSTGKAERSKERLFRTVYDERNQIQVKPLYS